jgi:hypothetical protein
MALSSVSVIGNALQGHDGQAAIAKMGWLQPRSSGLARIPSVAIDAPVPDRISSYRLPRQMPVAPLDRA